MGNLMTSFSTGVSGLRVSQASVNTSAHNLANVQTQGYVRQQMVTVDFAYNNLKNTAINTMQVGLGSNVAAIRQVRDVFLDKAYRVENGRLSFYQTQSETSQEVESLFGELEGEAFQNTISDFWKSIQEVTKEPNDIVKRTALVNDARTLIERATNLVQQLNKYQVSLNTEIMSKVDRINQIGDSIKVLNDKIRQYESGQELANDYRDKRNQLLDELSGLISITYTEEANGTVNVYAEGIQFVSDDRVSHLAVEKMDGQTNMLKVVWADNGCGDVFRLDQGYSMEKKTDIGSLRSLLIARGDRTANYTDIPKKEDSKYYTEDASGNKVFLQLQYEEDVTKYNNTVGASLVMSTQAQFDQLIHGIVTTMNDILCPNETIDTVMGNLGLDSQETELSYTTPERDVDGTKVRDQITITNTGKTTIRESYNRATGTWEVSGEPIVNNEVTIDNVKIWDEYNAPVGMDENSTPREALFNRNDMDRYTETTITCKDKDGNEVEKTIWVYNEENPDDYYSLYTIGEIEINQKILDNPSVLSLTSNEYQGKPGAYDVTICDQLTKAWQTTFATLDPNSLIKNTFTDYYTSMIGSLADKGKVAESITYHQSDTVDSIDNSRQQVMGVSSDEELTNLIMYQQAYNASSRYITVIDQMLEHIITNLG